MIDILTLLITLLLLGYILLRAVILDKTLPWFQQNSPEGAADGKAASNEANNHRARQAKHQPGRRFQPRFQNRFRQ